MISFVIPVLEMDSVFWGAMSKLQGHLESLGTEYEVVIVPNGLAEDSVPPFLLENFRILPRLSTPGKGSALKEGFRIASGRVIFMIDADLPYELDFIEKALEQIERGVDLVYSNRRHVESYFRVKVPTLHLAFRRHCFGLLFNRLARTALGIDSQDTQAGMKALSSRLAKNVAHFSTCPGFLFDLEIFVLAKLQNWKVSDLPVTFNLENEKSSVRLVRETVAILTWLPRIRLNLLMGRYSPNAPHLLAETT